MTKSESLKMAQRMARVDFLIQELLQITGERLSLPPTLAEKQKLLRALMNICPPVALSSQFLAAQNEELQQQREERGVVDIAERGLQLWQGDITRLRVDAIVNAANSQMLGCFRPLHACIDNAIHSAAGLQLRLACHEKMQQRHGEPFPTGEAMLTGGYNLPARYVIHTVGPIVSGHRPTPEQEHQLADCYRSSLRLAEAEGLESIAFCCISTGVFGFPNARAAQIAVDTVNNAPRWSVKTMIFNVFKDEDYALYQQLLQ